MPKTTYFWPEAEQGIGMGHLMESLALSREVLRRGGLVQFFVAPYPPAVDVLKCHGVPFVAEDHAKITQHMVAASGGQGNQNGTLVINHRAVDPALLETLHKVGLRVCVIDQLGDKQIISNLLVNPSTIHEWQRYTFPDRHPTCFFGPSYAIIDPAIVAFHTRKRNFQKKNFNILVTMGGVDRTGATLRIVDALRELGPSCEKHIIVGNGFPHKDELSRLKQEVDNSFSFFQNVADMGQRLFRADIVFSAGGGTLYEAACVGTPAIVLWEDPHERLLGKAFTEMGAAISLGNGISTEPWRIVQSARDLLHNVTARREMSDCGKRLIDGKGVERICDWLMFCQDEM
ncbi:MAG: hypothetical protein HQL45_12905 [Alphaproteobacteria bacterium]|nr:hypothetical protein [Alphaproteobacteria bacterium]